MTMAHTPFVCGLGKFVHFEGASECLGMDALAEATNGPIVEKVEGMTIDTDGFLWIVNDNDGDGGETLLLNLGRIALVSDDAGCSSVCVNDACMPCR